MGVALLRLGLFDSSSFDPRVQRTARRSPKNAIPTFDKSALAEKKKADPASVKTANDYFKGLEDEDEE